MANMSCFSKRDNKTKHLQRTNEAHCSNFVKHRIAKAKKLQKTMSLICDNEASPPKEIHPFFLNSCHNNSDDNSSDEEINGKMRAGKESLSFKTNEKSTTDKNIKNDVKNKKGSYRNIRKQKTKNKGSDSSGSEQKTHEKYADNMKKRHVVSKSIQEGLSKDDADSSSGKEFQKSKLSSMNLNAVIKLTQAREEHVMSTDSNSGSVTQIDKKTKISKEQSLRFKTHVVKILNRFKEVCSEYELKMEHVKWKHFKKELIHQESAANVIKRSKNVITILKTKLEAQEKELTNFYEEWYKNCSLENSDTEGSSLSEIESLHKTEDKEESDKSENILSAACIVSACDSDEIFSGSEEFILKRNTEKNKKNDLSLVEESPTKLIDSDNDNRNRAASPILGSNKNKEIHDKVNVRDNSNVLDSLSQPETCKSPENECIGNESLDDIFDENLAESTDITNNAKENKDNCESETTLKQMEIKESKINEDENKLETEALKQNLNSTDSDTDKVESLESVETKSIPFTEKSKTLKKDESNSSDDSEAEQKAKRTMLESDSETMNEDSPVQKSTKKSLDSKLKEKSNARSKTVKRSEEEKKSRKAEGGLTFDDSSSNEQDELSEVEACAKTALLDLNSDDSMSSDESENCIDKMNDSDDSGEDTLAKEKLLVSSNSESSSSENGGCNKLRAAKTDSISKKSKKDSLIEIMSTDCKEHGSSSKIGRTGSDKKLEMQPEIVLVRLSETVLEKYKNALDKSRQYLESKEIRSLVDLNRLQRSNRSMSSPQSSMFRRKSKVAKEKEDTLLNHLQEGEMGEGFVTRMEEDLNLENDIPTVTESSTIQTNEELMREADTATKKFLLNMSDSDIEEPKDTSENNDSEGDKDKTKSKTTTKQTNMKSEEKDKDNADSNYKENEDKREKTKWRRNKLLTTKFSSSPSSSDDDSNIGKGKEGLGIRLKELQEKEEENIELPAGKDELLKSKRRRRKKILDSDSDVQLLESNPESDNSVILENKSSSNSDSSVGKQKKMRKRKSRKSSDTDSSFTEKRSKPKRKRIKTMSSDSDNSDSDQVSNSQGTPGKKGRKNIRKVMKDKQVADDTKQAAKEEEERIMRIAERQKLYNEMYEARLAGEEKVDKLVLDFNPETKEELVSVDENLVKRLKPHQAKGIKFMWDACFESLERTKSSSGSGCIIAHCMGLGKTLQVISLVYTLLTHEETNVKTIMIVCPLSTVLNWLNEFKLWLKDIDNDIEVYEMTKMKKNIERKCQLESWQRTGGVLIIGYEMFRNLSGTNNRMKKTMKEKILQCLIDPGPDVIVCDEGHLLKNEDTALSKSMKQVKTLRRIVLTGTPLQNNLTEYHCMVQFVKPNLLGTRREFLNRFANPITNGQFDDSTEYDVKLMKKRAYVLHKMLKGCVQRFDYSVLTPFLPPKQEYVIFVRLTEVQINMYRHYLDNFARRTRTASGSLFADFQALQRIWTHPIVLKLNAEKMEKINERKFSSSDSEGSLKDFINDDSDSASSSNTASSNDDDDDVQSIDSAAGTRSTRSNPKNIKSEVEIVSKPDELEKKEEEWWAQFTKPEHFEDMKVSAKLLLLFGILRECEQIGDKVLVFSQSLYSLSLIEQFLRKIDNETENGENSENIDGHSGSWSLGLDYFRLDGQTSAENRNIWCKIFNQPSNTRARLFLISTRAGGLGINLTAANRVIIFDASWNPSHDVQSIFRIYRFGQKKPCYVYRFLAAGTMEEKIYNRQVTKLSLSCRVVDEQQIERHYSNNDLSELYKFEPNTTEVRSTLNLPKDRLLAEIFLKYKDFVENYHEHDSLLENKAEEELNEEERKQAWLEYEEEKKGKPPPMLVQYPTMTAIPNHLLLNQYNIPSTFNISTDYEKLRELLQKDYPNATPETQQMMTTRVLTDMYNYWERQAYKNVAGHINQNAAINQVQMRSQIPNLTRMPYMVPNMSQTLSNPQTTYRAPDIRPSEPDDDVVEVSSSTVNNKTTNQEE